MTTERPLLGRRIVVTRGAGKGDRLPALLEAAGATVVRIPLIAAEPLVTDDQLRAAVSRVGRGDRGSASAAAWLVLTSETAVHLVLDAVGTDGVAGIATAVVGPATARAMGSRGVLAELVATGQDAESLAAELAARGVTGARVLVVAAAGGRGVVASALRSAGADVEVVEAYRSVMPRGAGAQLRDELAARPPQALTFTSASTVRHCVRALGAAPPGVVALCIGPVTARAAGEMGFATVVTAAEHTAEGIVAAAVARLATAHQLP